MKKTAGIIMAVASLAFAWLAGCNDMKDKSEGMITNPQLSSVGDSADLVPDTAGNAEASEEYYIDMTPKRWEKWDGVSKMESGVTYEMTSEQLIKLLESDEKNRSFLDSYISYKNEIGMRKGKI